MKETAIKKISNILNINENEIKNIKRFEQGMSNYTYLFEYNNSKYVFRLIGDSAELYVDYINEYNVLKVLNNYDITGELVYFDINSGTKMSKYVEGSPIMQTSQNLVKTLKKLHNIKTDQVSDYRLIERLEKYESYNNKELIDSIYFEIKNWWIKSYNKYYKYTEKVLCHNDLQNINILDNGNEVKLIDFEYAGYNDLYYDIASYEANSELLFELYFNHKPTKNDLIHIKFYKIYQSLQWYQVALYKDVIGFSKKTNYNFKELAIYFIKESNKIYQEIKREME